MKFTPDILARALYASVKDLQEKEAEAAIGRFAAFVRGRIGPGMLTKVLERLPAAASRADGAEEVLIESARPLTPELAREILAAYGLDPLKTRVESRVSPELIGGVRIRRGDSVLDATVGRKIERLRQLTGAAGENDR